MAKLSSVKRFLDKELNVKKIKDSSKNGLQVKCKLEVKKIGFAVDGCLSTFEKAKKAKVDLLIVHHGIKWKGQKYPKLAKKRENFLKKNNISLYGAHLPLDAHAKYGNNIGLASILGLKNIKKFGRYSGQKVGYKGELKNKVNINQISKILNKKLETKCSVYPLGNNQIKKIAIVSGGGSSSLEEAKRENQDCFLIGEIDLGSYNRAKDYKINLITGGHYATETLGVKALMEPLKEKFNIQTIFIENRVNI